MNRKWGKKWMAAMLSISMVIGMCPRVGNPVRVLADEPPGQAVTQADISNADNSGKDKYGFNLTTPSSFNANDGENPYGSGYSAFNEKMEAFYGIDPVERTEMLRRITIRKARISRAIMLDRIRNGTTMDLCRAVQHPAQLMSSM